MNLVNSRNTFRERFQQGYKPEGVLEAYRTNRNNEEWRTTKVVEELLEYILYLESNYVKS